MAAQVTVVGNLVRDAEERITPTGKKVTKLIVASNDSFATQHGRVKTVTYFTCYRWGAADLAPHLKKGQGVHIVGTLTGAKYNKDNGTQVISPRTWETRDGDSRADFEVRVDSLWFVNGGNGNSNSNAPTSEKEVEEVIPF